MPSATQQAVPSAAVSVKPVMRACPFSAASRSTTGCRSSASNSRRNTAATRCWRSSTTVDGMTVVGYLPPKAIMVRIDGS